MAPVLDEICTLEQLDRAESINHSCKRGCTEHKSVDTDILHYTAPELPTVTENLSPVCISRVWDADMNILQRNTVHRKTSVINSNTLVEGYLHIWTHS